MSGEFLGTPVRPESLINRPDGFCGALVDRGSQVIRFDTRDSGRSTHSTDAPVPDFAAALAGDLSTVACTLSDLAADTVGLLDRGTGRRS
ncbi:hypothetical protein [Streptomyces sp. NPDC050548]|uniref:hypothetical protein n=1 Tax=Streptomyces sp. NPDC050548 TaxID=3365629 RepID=UPI0037BA6DEE